MHYITFLGQRKRKRPNEDIKTALNKLSGKLSQQMNEMTSKIVEDENVKGN
jgi:hypothetical protein